MSETARASAANAKANWPAHLPENRYEPEEVLSALAANETICPKSRPKKEWVVMVRAYAWYYSKAQAPRCCVRTRIRKDIADYREYGALPDYVFRAYEKRILGLA